MFDISNTCIQRGSLDGEVAVITGGTSNVGKGFAQAIAWAGGKVVIVGRTEERGIAVMDEINADNGDGTAIYVQADVSKEDNWALIFKKAKESKYNILINNAGTMLPFLRAEKIKNEDKRKIYQKLSQHLSYKGFSYDIIKSVLNKILNFDEYEY